jgi:hypothetical protein
MQLPRVQMPFFAEKQEKKAVWKVSLSVLALLLL